MLGFAPVAAAAAAAVEPAMAKVNEALAAYKEAWDSAVDSWLVIRIGDPQVGPPFLFLFQGGEGGCAVQACARRAFLPACCVEAAPGSEASVPPPCAQYASVPARAAAACAGEPHGRGDCE